MYIFLYTNVTNHSTSAGSDQGFAPRPGLQSSRHCLYQNIISQSHACVYTISSKSIPKMPIFQIHHISAVKCCTLKYYKAIGLKVHCWCKNIL